MKMRRHAAFYLVELIVAMAISTVVGLIAYGIASEGVISFARNVSINRSYTNVRQTVARIAKAMESAGHVSAARRCDRRGHHPHDGGRRPLLAVFVLAAVLHHHAHADEQLARPQPDQARTSATTS